MTLPCKPLMNNANAEFSATYPKAYPQNQWITFAAADAYFNAACTMSRTLSKPAIYCGFSDRANSVE
ncbi:Uncharacterised protein [Bordetella holmesii]|nr:Uncharacterised protein [Bordetella holmesii]